MMKDIRKLYLSNFDESIRLPWKLIRNRIRRRIYTPFLLVEKGCNSGFVLIRNLKHYTHVEYLCVTTKGKGYGSLILSHLQKLYKNISLDCTDELVPFYKKNKFEVYSWYVHNNIKLNICYYSEPCYTQDLLSIDNLEYITDLFYEFLKEIGKEEYLISPPYNPYILGLWRVFYKGYY